MEQLNSNINFIEKSYSRRGNSSIKVERKSYLSDSKSLNEVVFIMQFQKAIEFIESKPESIRQGIELLYPLLQKSSQIKSSKTKIYYIKQNIMITLIKLLNKQGDQLKILECFNENMPDMIRQAKLFQAKKGNIIMMIVLWAKCCYSIQKYSEALLILEKTSGLIQMFQNAKLINILKISFLKSKIYEQQKRTEDYHNEISYAYFIVKSNNILSTLGLKITQIYHNIKPNDDVRKESMHRGANKSFSKQKQKDKQNRLSKITRQSLQAYPKYGQRYSRAMSNNRKSNSNTSHNLSSEKDKQRDAQRPRGSSSQTKKISSSIRSNQFNYVLEDIKKSMTPAKQKRSTFLVENQLTSQLMELGHYKQTSHIEKNNSILKRPVYKKYSLCHKTIMKFNQQFKQETIQQQAKDTDKQQDMDVAELDIISKEGRNDRSSQVQLLSNVDREGKEEDYIDILAPLIFPTEYIRQNDQKQDVNESFDVEFKYKFSFWSAETLLSIKKIVARYQQRIGIHFKIYFWNSENVIVVKVPYQHEQKMVKQYFCQYLSKYFKIKSQEDILSDSQLSSQRECSKLKQISRTLVFKHMNSKIVSPIGRVYQLQTRPIKLTTKKKFQIKDRLRYDIPRQSKKSRKSCHFRKIVSESELVEIVQRNYFNLYQVMEYSSKQLSIIDEIIEHLPEINILESKSHTFEQDTELVGIDTLIPYSQIKSKLIQTQIRTGKYTFRSDPTSQNQQKKPYCSPISQQILIRIFNKTSSVDLRQFYQLMKYNLIIQQSKPWILQYFDELTITSIFAIQGIGTSKVELNAYFVKGIYQRDYMFFKFQISPMSTKTKKIKFVVTKDDIKQYINIDVPRFIDNNFMFFLLKKFESKFSYIKDSLYFSLVVNTNQHYGYNKFVFYQYEHMNNPKLFLTSKLKDVKILQQKTVRIQVQNKRSFVVLTVQHLKGNDIYKILIYVPTTNRKLEFSLPQRTLNQFEGIDRSNPNYWGLILSKIKFNTLQNNTLIAEISSCSYLVIESHFSSFGKVRNHVFHVCFKVFNKKNPHYYNFLSQFQNIILNELTDYQVFLQINWLKNNRKLCFVFSIIDFIELLLHLPSKKNKVHQQLDCIYFNLADIRLMLSIGYQQIVASLLQFTQAELEQLIQSKAGKHRLQKLIEQNLKKASSNKLSNAHRKIKSSMNSRKETNRQDCLDIIHKGIYRYKQKSLIGLFNNSKSQEFIIKAYCKDLDVSEKQWKFKQLNIPFVGNKRSLVLKECNNRIMKMMKNKLLCMKITKK